MYDTAKRGGQARSTRTGGEKLMKKRILSILLCCMMLMLLPAYAAATETEDKEQFNLEPGNEYCYFYIEEWKSYVRFNYAGTVDAYVLNNRSQGSTTAAEDASEHTQNIGTWFGYTYTHSLFIARSTYLKGASWDALNEQGLIFGKTYESNGVKYTMRAPTVGSNYRELEEGWKVTPANNEWDAILNKGINIRNAAYCSSWGQDTTKYDRSYRAARGGETKENRGAQIWGMYESGETEAAELYYRPVLEVMNAEELGKDGLKVVTLDMNGGNLLPSSVQDPKIIVRGGTATFTAPTATGIKRPRGNTSRYLKWLGDDGVLYEPGAEVPATVTKLAAQWNVPEQFSLEPGETYYFDLSKKGLYTASEIRRGKVCKDLPDKTLHYVPFTYAGTVDAYVLNSNAANVAAAVAEASATTDPNAQYGYTFKHSLFIADYILKNKVSWKELNQSGWIFGKNYNSGNISYTMRAPTVGSGINAENVVTPANNEWDAIADKSGGYIKNWVDVYTWGQDSAGEYKLNKAVRGLRELRKWRNENQGTRTIVYGYRPVLEVKNAADLGPEALKVVTLQLEEANVGGKNSIKIIVRSGQTFTAPSCEGLTVAEGYDRASFRWKDSDGNLYSPGVSVPATVTELKAQWGVTEQFSLEPGGTYYFDLSAVGGSHYQAFTYAGTVGAYRTVKDSENNEHSGNDPHTLFVSENSTRWCESWDTLNGEGLIFGKAYESNGVDYAMRAPTGGNRDGGNNEWDRILDKNETYIKGGFGRGNWCQDKLNAYSYTLRGDDGKGVRAFGSGMGSHIFYNYRPVLEVMNAKALGQDSLKAVTLQLNGGTVDGKTQIQIIVKNGETFTAPVLDGIGKPGDYTEGYFQWLGNDGQLYAPGDSVPATVDTLTAQFAPSSSVTITTVTLPDGKVDEAYSQTLTANGTTPIIWSIENGSLPAGLSLDKDTGEISGTPTADGTAKFTVKAENRVGSDMKELSITIDKAEPPVHEHTYSNWIADGETDHYRVCTDENCTFADKGRETEAHRYDDDADTTCNVCGYERTVTPPVHEHSYGDWTADGETGHYRVCTDENCTSADKGRVAEAHRYDDDADMICNACGYMRTVTPSTHEHSYGDWSKDGTNHWHECTDADCPDRDESIKDKAPHVYTDDTDTTAAEFSDGFDVAATHVYTDDADTTAAEFGDGSDVAATHVYTGDADTTCKVCGYERTVTPPVHEHSYSNWIADGETGHYRVCTDANCTSVDKGRETEAHRYDDDADTTCNVCGYERTVTPPVHEHSYDNWIADGETGHYRVCTDENCTSADKGRETEAHRYDDNADTTCNVCGYERTVTPPVHEHSYSDWTADGETGHYRVCTDENCTSADKGRETEAHRYDDDADMICNACGYERTVTPPSHEHSYPVTGIKVSPDTLALTRKDETAQLTAEVIPSYADNTRVTWKSSDESVVTVDEKGKVTAVGNGTATITVTSVSGNYTATVAVTVKIPVEIARITIEAEKETLTKIGESTELKVKIEPENADAQKLIWKSGDEMIAVVDENGKVTAIGNGTVIITVTTEDGKNTASITITVKIPDEPVINKTKGFGRLKVRSVNQTKTSITLEWSKLDGVDGYFVYGNRCNTKTKTYKYQKLATVTNGRTWTHKNLKKGTFYKYIVKAYKIVDGKKVVTDTSASIHVITQGGKYGIAKSVSVTKIGNKKNVSKITLKKGKTAQITAKEIKKDKKIRHHRNLCYESSNTAVAIVTLEGLIQAVGKGTCTIWVYAQNGVYAALTVTVR